MTRGACVAATAILFGTALAPSCGTVATSAPRVPSGPFTAIAVDDHGLAVQCASDGVQLVRDGVARPIALDRGRAIAAAALPDGGFVLGGGRPARDGWLRVLAADATLTEPRVVADDLVDSVAVEPRAGRVVAGCIDGRVLLLRDPRGDREPIELARHAGPCRAVAFAPSAPPVRIVSGGRDGRLLFVDLDDDAAPRVREILDHTAGIDCLAVAADGRVASGARDGRVRLHARDGALLRTWQRLGAAPLCVLADDDDGWWCGLVDGRLLVLRDDRDDPELRADFGQPIHALARRGDEILVGLQAGTAAIRRRP